jgi:hypothetical protein
VLKQLIYASHATCPMREDDLLSLMAGARDRNRQNNVTGMLVYKDSLFLQAMEGEDGDLEPTWARIQADPRHENLVIIRHLPIGCRDFPDWSMGFVNMSNRDLTTVPGYSRFMEADFSLEGLRAKPGLALDFLLDMKYLELDV